MKLKHPKESNIKFNSKGHTYSVGTDKYTSVTTLVSKFFPKFNRQLVSKRYAKKYGLNQQDVINMWKDKQKKAVEIGNRCHSYANNMIRYLSGLEKKKFIKPYDIRFAIITDKLIELLNNYIFIGSECVIYSLKFKIAGTFDLLFVDNLGNPLLFDWKFVEKVEKDNQWETGFDPITHLDNSRFNKFALQLNLYDFIINTENYFLKKVKCKKFILHVTDEDCYEIEVPDMNKEIKNIILTKEWLNGKNKK